MRKASPALAVSIRTRCLRASTSAPRSSALSLGSAGSRTSPTRTWPQDVLRPADVIALRMREDDHRQARHSQPPELTGDVRFGRALVDEHRSARDLDQRAVALTDVQERDPQPRRRRRHRRAAVEAPPARDESDSEDNRDELGSPRAASTSSRGRRARGSTPAPTSAARAETAAYGSPPTSRAHPARYAASQPLTHARAAASGGATGATIAVTSAIPRSGATTGAASALAGIEYTGIDAELREQDRRCRDPAGAGNGNHLPERARHRIPGQRPLEARDDDEDRRDGGEGELESRVEQRVRAPGEEQRRSEEQEVPAIARTRREPRERGERPRDSRAHHGGLPAHCEDVAADRNRARPPRRRSSRARRGRPA